MKKICVILLFLGVFSARATHVVGGNFYVEQIGRNQFFIELTIFRDCRTNVNPQPVQLEDQLEVKVFDNSDYTNFISFYVSKRDSLRPKLGDKCFEPTDLCIQEFRLTDTISLADNPAGYTLAMQLCCRNESVDNVVLPTRTGMTLTAEIPDPALAGGNSTPKLKPYPKTGFFCLNNLRTLDFSASDPDGDSLYYELVTPYSSPEPNQSNPNPALTQPPYNLIKWLPGYSFNYPIPGNPSLKIDSRTGELSIVPSALGLYVFAYKISEYRNGQFIGSIRRDIQLEVLNCIINQKPEFREPQQTEFSTPVSTELCVPVRVHDLNSADTIFLEAGYALLNSQIPAEELKLVQAVDTGTAEGKVCWQPTCEEVFAGQTISIMLKSYSKGCDATDSITRTITLEAEPLPQDLESLLPNIFTPNGDDVNDLFQLQNLNAYPCIENLEVRIFNRWGIKVHEEQLSHLGWNGTYNNNPVPEGVYYYIISGSYRNGPFSYKSFVTLKR